MPSAEVQVFRDASGASPILEWLEALEAREPNAYAKCLAFILDLAEKGYQMRRPHADSLRDGIHELRPSLGGIQYRILYAFIGKNVVCLTHGITKTDVVPPKEIELAISRISLVHSNKQLYTADFDLE